MATDKITEVPLDESRGKLRIGFNEHGEYLASRRNPQRAVFVEVRGSTYTLTDARYGVFSVDEAKRVIVKLQEVVDHYDNYRPIDALGLGAVVQNKGSSIIYINVGNLWTDTSGYGSASHAAINEWLVNGTFVVKHEGYKLGGSV
jgi:hypothetical protein